MIRISYRNYMCRYFFRARRQRERERERERESAMQARKQTCFETLVSNFKEGTVLHCFVRDYYILL